jgi:hypothetical protein
MCDAAEVGDGPLVLSAAQHDLYDCGYWSLFPGKQNPETYSAFATLFETWQHHQLCLLQPSHQLPIFLIRTKSFINTRTARNEVSVIIPRICYFIRITCNGFVLRQSRRMPPCKFHCGSPAEASQSSTGNNSKISCKS